MARSVGSLPSLRTLRRRIRDNHLYLREIEPDPMKAEFRRRDFEREELWRREREREEAARQEAADKERRRAEAHACEERK